MNEIDLTLHELEVDWRKLKVDALNAEINYLRYLSQKIDALRSEHEIIKPQQQNIN
ncbi:hypothetical protein I4U23_010747 [Adineta vaga]|nr:hypothetical protein I4U23_010747 [Adineta vaga]